jgi:hypothetical protein
MVLTCELFFLTMESRLSRRLSWNFLSQDGSRLSRSLSRTFLSHDGIQAITKPFHEFWQWLFTRHILWGKTLFIYITKIIYIASALLKTWPLDLGLPLQGKEYGPPYSKLSTKKYMFLFLKPLIDPWFGVLHFYEIWTCEKKCWKINLTTFKILRGSTSLSC